MATDGPVTPEKAVPPTQGERKVGLLDRFRRREAKPTAVPPTAPPKDVSKDLDKVRAELGKAAGPKEEGSKDKDIVAELMPKVQEILAREGPVDEAKMLRLMAEIEKSGELKERVHTLGEGKDRAVILKNAVQGTTESTSYAPAEHPRELLPVGTMTTVQSEWLAMNRKGFIKYIVVDGQTLKIDETSEFFDGRRNPDSNFRDYSGPVEPVRYYIEQMRKWADQVEGYVRNTYGQKNEDLMYRLLQESNYPPGPSKSPFDSYSGRPPQPELDKFSDEKDLNAFGYRFHPESGWSHFAPTEEQRKASRALRRGDNPVGWELNHWYHGFYRVASSEFVQEALKTNVKPLS